MAVTQENTIVIKMGAAADAITGFINVNFLYWHSKGAAADEDLVVSDAAGNILWVDTADQARYKNFCPIKNKVNGITVTTMDSGELYVYKVAEWPMQV